MRFFNFSFIDWMKRRWPAVLVGWILVAAVLRWIAPAWNSIVLDGDLDFIPAALPSRATQRLLDQAFTENRGRSQLSIVFARDDRPLDLGDQRMTYDVARRLTHESAVALYLRDRTPIGSSAVETDRAASLEQVRRKLDEAIAMDQIWFDLGIQEERGAAPEHATVDSREVVSRGERLAIAYRDRADVLEELGRPDAADQDREIASILDPNSVGYIPLAVRESPWGDLLDVWTWDDPTLGSKLADRDRRARLIVMQLATDFMAVRNVATVDRVRKLIELVRRENGLPGHVDPSPLDIGLSGNAVVGGDMLRAAADNIRQTEWITIVSIIAILSFLYRSPILVAVPLISIGVSLTVATSLIALLADGPGSDVGWKPLKVFSTSRIFIVVLLFGVGTDFCMFLVARFREALTLAVKKSTLDIDPNDPAQRASFHREGVWAAWEGVAWGIIGSGVTTIVGLSMLYFSDFEKFRFTGILIAISLAITLLVCLTLTPCLLVALGPWLTTVQRMEQVKELRDASSDSKRRMPRDGLRLWIRIADIVVGHPWLSFGLSLCALGIPAVYSLTIQNRVSYDLVKELSDNATSRLGIQLISKHFHAFDASPITLLITRPDDVSDEAMREAIEQIKPVLYAKGAISVRTVSDPLGEFPPGKRMGLLSADAWRRRALERHPMVQSRFVATKQSALNGRLARFDIVISQDPFSVAAAQQLSELEGAVRSVCRDTASPWYQSAFSFGGTTAGTVDLRRTTQSDQSRIQMLVTIGILCALMILLRQFLLSVYLVATVLLSFLSTLGCSYLFFSLWYGESFVGLNWKVPLFLFVILVAVGQDYNVYLVTRVFEERHKHGDRLGLHRAMVQTGGIITSCGLIMAATFASMALGGIARWLGQIGFPWWLGGNPEQLSLNGILELGFALSVGVLIDTLIVRTVLVPSGMAIASRVQRYFSPSF